jgi:PQQ-dependent dehydrogenase (methanol/ethanol family)
MCLNRGILAARVFTLGLLVAPMDWAAAGSVPSVAPPFTLEQAQAGSLVYSESCAVCHDPDLLGKSGPALIGPWVLDEWTSGNRTIEDLRNYLKENMPLTAPGTLTEAQYIDVTAFLLSKNDYKPGRIALSQANLHHRLQLPGSASSRESLAGGPRSSFPIYPKSVQKASTEYPDDDEIRKPSERDWLIYNHSLDATRYSKLDQINSVNAADLHAACIFQLGELGAFEAAPVVYNGMMYVTSPYNTYAIDPATCKLQWVHNQKPGAPRPSNVSRGVAIYKGEILRVTPDCHVLALDAKTGTPLWDVVLCDVSHGYWLSAAPVAYDGKVFVGESGADWGADAHIYALDVESGKVVWRFNVIPTGDEIGADSWKAGAERGGGSIWSSFTLQPENGLLYASIGNPAPDFMGAARPGDNLFTDSVVVLDFRTGRLAWWVQQVPHDVHDWDTAAAPIVYEQDNKSFLAVGNKGGWLYLYDRTDHALLAKPEVSDHLNENLPLTPQGVHHCPGVNGGVMWNGPAYSPANRMLFVNSVHWCGTTRFSENRYLEGSAYFGGSHTFDPPELAYGQTSAFDAASGRAVWVRKSDTPMLAALTPTAGGIVFTGDLNGNFLALDAKTGNALYRFNTGGSVAGAPSTYMVDGKQYVAITSGNQSRFVWKSNGAMTVVVFSL